MMLILDEAQTGVGRTGLMFAFERDGVVPDILTLSKTLGAGLPLSAVLTSDAIAAEAERREFLFYTTHVNDPLPAARGAEGAGDRAARRAGGAGEGDGRAAGGGAARACSSGSTASATCAGGGCCWGWSSARSGGRDAAAISDAVTDVALELGLSANIVRAGASQGVMRIAPPLTVSEAEVDLGVELLGEAIGRSINGTV